MNKHIMTISRRALMLGAGALVTTGMISGSRAMAETTTTRTIHADGVTIATEAFGDPSAPPVLLIMGAMASMLWWPDEFCRKLAARGRYVIRYDNRDTGLSTKYPPGNPPYRMDDMAEDAAAVLDAYGIASAHVVAMSLGGMIAQILALTQPRRVSSLTLLRTTPIGLDLDLPPPTPAYMDHASTGEKVDWSDRSQAIDFVAADVRMIAGTAYPHDAAGARAFIERDYDRSGGFLSATNHFMLQGGDAVKGKLPTLDAPLLVIHGAADPIFPVEHGRAIAKAVPGARYLELEGGGHEIHRAEWERIVDAVAGHTSVS